MLIKEIGIIFIFAGVLGVMLRLLKQPLIPAYVLAGVFIGPLCFQIINHPETITELSEIAVVVMLFVIGIEMDLSRLKRVGLVAILGGVIQVVLTFFIGFGISKLFGLGNIAAAYFGFGLSFSSTMLVVKILGDKRDMETLYGRIVIGILIIQDICAIFALAVLSTVSNFSGQLLLSTVTLAAGLILVVVFVCGRFVFPKLFSFAARERELLFIISMAILFIVAFYAENQKLSLGIGSFLAGISVAGLSYKYEIIGDLKALKSFFTILFFAALGLQLAPDNLFTGDIGFYSRLGSFATEVNNHLGFIIVLGITAIVIKPLMIIIIVSIFGYNKSTILNSGLSLGHLSEFSLVLIAQGIAAGHINPMLLSPIIIVTITSMILSSYLMNYNFRINKWLDKYTNWVEKIKLVHTKFDFENNEIVKNGFDVLLVGRDKLGRVIEHALRKINVRYLVVDSNPDVISQLIKEKIPCIFGDINNHEVLEQLNFGKIKTIFSTVPDLNDNELLIEHIKETNPNINLVGIVDSRTKAEQLYKLGAHFVLVTYMLAGTQLLCSRGEHEDAVSLNFFLEELEQVREKGKKHRKSLFKDPFIVRDEDPEPVKA